MPIRQRFVYLIFEPLLWKVEAIEKIALNLASLLEQDKPLPNNTDLEPPSSILFANYFLAQHFCRVKKFSEALTHIDKCIQHTPTQVDWYTYRARILKARYHLATDINTSRLPEIQ